MTPDESQRILAEKAKTKRFVIIVSGISLAGVFLLAVVVFYALRMEQEPSAPAPGPTPATPTQFSTPEPSPTFVPVAAATATPMLAVVIPPTPTKTPPPQVTAPAPVTTPQSTPVRTAAATFSPTAAPTVSAALPDLTPMVPTGVLVGWDMDTNTGANPRQSAVNDPGVAPATLALGSGLVGNKNFPKHGSWTFSRAHEPDLAAAVTNDRYVSFTLTPAAGHTVTIQSLVVYAWSRVTPGNYALEASTSGFGPDPANNLGTWSVKTSEMAPASHTFTLAKPITTSSSVEFRFYVWGCTNQYNELGFGKNAVADGVTDLAVCGTVQSASGPTPASSAKTRATATPGSTARGTRSPTPMRTPAR